MLSRIARSLLVATSLAPVAVVYSASQCKTNPVGAIASAAASVVLLALCLGILRVARTRIEVREVQIARTKNIDKDALAFLVSYALPLLVPSTSESSLYALVAFIVIVCLVLYQLQALHVNPLLGLVGYHFLEVITGAGEGALLITRSSSIKKNGCRVVRLSDYVWLHVA